MLVEEADLSVPRLSEEPELVALAADRGLTLALPRPTLFLLSTTSSSAPPGSGFIVETQL